MNLNLFKVTKNLQFCNTVTNRFSTILVWSTQMCLKVCHCFFLGWSDIGYSFVIGEDGNVYEGRGWDTVGAHTLHHNTDGLGKKWNDLLQC